MPRNESKKEYSTELYISPDRVLRSRKNSLREVQGLSSTRPISWLTTQVVRWNFHGCIKPWFGKRDSHYHGG